MPIDLKMLDKPRGLMQRLEERVLQTGTRLADTQVQTNKAFDVEARNTNKYFEAQKNQLWWRTATSMGLQIVSASAGAYWPDRQVVVQSLGKAAETLVSSYYELKKLTLDQDAKDSERKTIDLNQTNQYLIQLSQAHATAMSNLNQQKELASRG
jgi:hypothetical protein